MKGPGPISGLYTIIESSYVPLKDASGCARALLEGGSRIVQLRAKDAPASSVLQAALSIAQETRKRGAAFIVNDRVDIAMLSGADGVHLGQDDIPIEDARRLLGKDSIIGVSTHSLAEAVRAVDAGADYVSFGPIFATSTKKDADVPKGAALLKEITDNIRIPVVAIGGIDRSNLPLVLASNPSAVAVISAILLSGDVRASVAEFVSLTSQ